MDGSVEASWRGERRTRLLGAAARVFSRLSYDQASVDEIAREAGIGKPTLYRYYASKDALFSAVFGSTLDRLEARLREVVVRERGTEARLVGLLTALIPTFRDHLVSPRVLGAGTAEVDQSVRRIFRERRARIAAVIAEAIGDGIVRGEVRASADPKRIAHLLIGMAWSGAAAFEAEDPDIAREIAALILQGVGARAEPDRPADVLDRPRHRPASARAPAARPYETTPS